MNSAILQDRRPPRRQQRIHQVVTLAVFVPFAVLYMKQPIKLDFLWAGLCLLGAVYSTFRGNLPA